MFPLGWTTVVALKHCCGWSCTSLLPRRKKEESEDFPRFFRLRRVCTYHQIMHSWHFWSRPLLFLYFAPEGIAQTSCSSTARLGGDYSALAQPMIKRKWCFLPKGSYTYLVRYLSTWSLWGKFPHWQYNMWDKVVFRSR